MKMEMELEIIAHRGFSAIAPENTLAAFAAAVENSADSVEFDLQLTADGVPVVIHNPTLDKTTGTPGNVTEKTITELKDLDAGSWFNPQFAGEKIPTLAETLAILQPLPQHIYLDVKPHCQWSDSQVAELVEMLIAQGWQERAIVSSFNPQFVEQVRQTQRGLTLGYIVANVEDYEAELAKAIHQGNSVMISEYHLVLNHPSLVAKSRDRGVDIVVWTVDDPNDLQALVNIGVRRIVTNSLVGKSRVSR